jgi:HK97 family phage prohead protease
MLRTYLPLNDCELKFATAEGAFSGYGSVFGNVDSKNDIVMPGAYSDVLASGAPVDVYVNHDWMSGQLPVGRWSDLKEDDRGLFGAAGLVMQMSRAADAYHAMKAGLVSGLSVAFIPDPKAIVRRSDGVREIHRVKMLKEISIVTDPANPAAQVTSIKYADGSDLLDEIEKVGTLRELESFLRDAGGLSKGAAQALTARVKTMFDSRDAEEQAETKQVQEVLSRLQRLAA